MKWFYKQTNRIQFPCQIAKQEQIQHHFCKYITALRKQTGAKKPSGQQQSTQVDETRSPNQHYSTSVREHNHVDLYRWAHGQHRDDPALKVDLAVFYT